MLSLAFAVNGNAALPPSVPQWNTSSSLRLENFFFSLFVKHWQDVFSYNISSLKVKRAYISIKKRNQYWWISCCGNAVTYLLVFLWSQLYMLQHLFWPLKIFDEVVIYVPNAILNSDLPSMFPNTSWNVCPHTHTTPKNSDQDD